MLSEWNLFICRGVTLSVFLSGYSPWGHKESDMIEHTHTHTRFLSGSVGCGYLSAVLIGASLVPGNGMAHLSLPEKDPRVLVRNTFSHITTRTIAFSQEHLVKDLWCLTFSPRTQGFPYLSPVFQQFYNRCFHTQKKKKKKKHQKKQELITKP